MSIDCNSLKELASGFSLIRDCDILADGALRVSTAFQYPDGSMIDVFFRENAPPPEEDPSSLIRGILLSDFGQTMTYLMDLGVKLSSTNKKRRIVQDICASTDVDYRRGEFQIWIDSRDTEVIGDKIAQLILACVRVADLSFFQKYPSDKPFREEVRSFIGADNVEASPGNLTGRWGRDVAIDFIVRGKKRRSLVKTVSTGGMVPNIHPYLTEAFSRWYDLEPVYEKDKRITVIDEKDRVNRNDDLDRLKTVSEVVVFPRDRDRFREILAAA